MKSCILILFLIFSVVLFGFSQSEKLSDKKILAKKINEEIILDGEMTENFGLMPSQFQIFFNTDQETLFPLS